jgi:hypothetical protein
MSRFTKKTPNFWKKVRAVSIIVGAAAGAILIAPVALPAAAVTGLTLVVTAAGSVAATAQATQDNE